MAKKIIFDAKPNDYEMFLKAQCPDISSADDAADSKLLRLKLPRHCHALVRTATATLRWPHRPLHRTALLPTPAGDDEAEVSPGDGVPGAGRGQRHAVQQLGVAHTSDGKLRSSLARFHFSACDASRF